MAIRDRVVISADPVSIEDIAAIADGAQTYVSGEAWDRIRASRATLEAALDRDEAVYGATTGVGHARDVSVEPARVGALDPQLVRVHAGSFGPPMPSGVVRAVMAARVVGLTRGGAGASPAVAEMLLAMLNRRVTPVVPTTGSVGAADLAAHAAIGLVALGEGRAEFEGRVVSGAEALRDAGLRPLVLAPKDGIALISANGVTVGQGCLVLRRAAQVLALADRVAATSMDAWSANPSVLDPLVQEAKGSPGQVSVANRMRDHLSGSERISSPRSLQDPLSYRVTPQVHGACLDVMHTARAAMTTELNAMADNPLAAAGSDRVLSNGNFHPMLVALSFESLRVALAHVAQLSDRRTGQLWDSAVETLGAEPTEQGSSSALVSGLLLRYASAARSTDARRLADPVTLDVPVLDLGQEDHATNAPAAVAATEQLLDVLLDVLAVEALTAHGVLAGGIGPSPGAGTARMLDALTYAIGLVGDAPASEDVHAAARAALVAVSVDTE